MHRPTFALVLATSLFASLNAAASAKPLVHLHLQGAQEGAVVRYALVATNDGADPATKLISTTRVPDGTQFVSAGAAAAARIEFSLDGGKTWAARPLVKVATAHGTVERDAPASAYTALRWIEAAPLGAHRTVTYSYEVRVK
jgi:uncharacterized repeat protein (TIGR01451 family)